MITLPLRGKKGVDNRFWMCLYKGVESVWFGNNPLVIGDYIMAKSATALATVSLDMAFKLGRKSYTMSSAIDHVVACYDKLHLLQEESLDLYREIGNFIIQTKGLFGGDKKAYGKFIAGTDFSNEAVSQPDKYDSEFIATHWGKIQTLNKSGKLNSLTPSRIRQILQEEYPELAKKPKASKGAGNVSKGKGAKGSEEPTVIKNTVFETVLAKNEKELAEQVFDAMEKAGFARSAFAKELAKLYKK